MNPLFKEWLIATVIAAVIFGLLFATVYLLDPPDFWKFSQ